MGLVVVALSLPLAEGCFLCCCAVSRKQWKRYMSHPLDRGNTLLCTVNCATKGEWIMKYLYAYCPQVQTISLQVSQSPFLAGTRTRPGRRKERFRKVIWTCGCVAIRVILATFHFLLLSFYALRIQLYLFPCKRV